MKHYALLYLITALLLAACGVQTKSPYPASLQPAAAQPLPTQMAETNAAPVVLATPTLLSQPSSTPEIRPTPTVTPTVTPVAIDVSSAAGLRPVEIYPLYRRGLLRQVLWSPDGTNLVVETSLGLQVLSVPDLQKRFNLPDSRPLYFLANGELLIENTDSLSILDLNGGGTRPLNVKQTQGAFALSPDGASWVTSPDGVSLNVENLAEQTSHTVEIASTTKIAFQIQALYFSPDGTHLYTQVNRIDGQIELLVLDTKEWKQLYTSYNNGNPLYFSADNRRVVYTYGDGIRVDVVADGKNWNNLAHSIQKAVSKDKTDLLTAQAYSFLQGSQKLGVLYNDQFTDKSNQDNRFFPSTLMIYNLDTSEVERYINDLPARLSSFAFSPDGKQFITTGRDGSVSLWDSGSGSLLKAAEPYDIDATPQIRADGQLVAYSLVESVALVNPISGEQVAQLGNYPDASHLEARFAGENTLAVFVETPWKKYIETFDIASKKFLARYPDPGNCSFNWDGSVMICYDGVLRFYDMPSGQAILDQVPQGSSFEYAVSRNGSRVAYCNLGSGFIYIYSPRLGTVPKLILGQQPGTCGKLAFSADEQTLASSSGFYWSLVDGKLINHFEAVTTSGPAAISADGNLLLVYPEVIDLQSGKKVAEMQSVPGIQAIYFQPDGQHLVLQTRRGVEIWMAGPK